VLLENVAHCGAQNHFVQEIEEFLEEHSGDGARFVGVLGVDLRVPEHALAEFLSVEQQQTDCLDGLLHEFHFLRLRYHADPRQQAEPLLVEHIDVEFVEDAQLLDALSPLVHLEHCALEQVVCHVLDGQFGFHFAIEQHR